MTEQLLNNKQINDLINKKVIQINPYDISKLQIAQYPLFPKTVWEINEKHKMVEVFQFDEKNKSFVLKPKKYYLIDVLEDIILPLGIVGRFIPSSNIIEMGISLTTGKIEFPYGQNKEKIRFGILNCLDIETTIKASNRIAYIQLFDLRGVKSLDYKQTNYDNDVYSKRIYKDFDAPNYEIDIHE